MSAGELGSRPRPRGRSRRSAAARRVPSDRLECPSRVSSKLASVRPRRTRRPPDAAPRLPSLASDWISSARSAASGRRRCRRPARPARARRTRTISSAWATPSATTASRSPTTSLAAESVWSIAASSVPSRSRNSDAVDHHRGRHRHRAGVLHRRAELVQAGVDSSFIRSTSLTLLLGLGRRSASRSVSGCSTNGRDQGRDVAAERGHLLDQRGGQEGVLRAGGDEHRLDVDQRGVHLRHLQLVVEVADRAQALDDGADAALLAERGEQALEAGDRSRSGTARTAFSSISMRSSAENSRAVRLGLVHTDGDHDLVEELGRPAGRCRCGRW